MDPKSRLPSDIFKMHMTRHMTHDAVPEQLTTSNDENKLLHFQVDELKEYKAQATEYSEKLSKEEKNTQSYFQSMKHSNPRTESSRII